MDSRVSPVLHHFHVRSRPLRVDATIAFQYESDYNRRCFPDIVIGAIS